MCFWQITRIWFIRFSQYCILWLLLMIFNYQEIFFVLIKVSCPRFRGIKVRNCAPNGFLPVSTKMGGSKLSSWAIFFRCMQFVCGEVGGGFETIGVHCSLPRCELLCLKKLSHSFLFKTFYFAFSGSLLRIMIHWLKRLMEMPSHIFTHISSPEILIF